MASLLGFPSNPTNGQTYTVGQKVYSWNGYAWQVNSSGGGTGTAGTIPAYTEDPASPTNGQIYLNTTSGKVKVYYNLSWMNLAKYEELIAHRHTYSGDVVFPSEEQPLQDIDGGTPSTTQFDLVIDGGLPGTTIFENIVDSGTIV